MESEKRVKTWVSDKLKALLGYSNPIVVEYIIGLTEQATSPAVLVDKLEEFQFRSSSERVDFADEVFARVHRKPFYLNPCEKHSQPFTTQGKFSSSAALQYYRDLITAWDEAFTKHPSAEEKKQKAWQDYQIEKARLNDQLLKFKEKSTSEKLQLLEKIESSPLYRKCFDLVEAVRCNQVVVIHGETGSRKSTLVPKILLEAAIAETTGKKIGCIQPSRGAALSGAARVSQEMSVKFEDESNLGEEAGYILHFEDCTSKKTVLEFMTDGILFRQFLVEPDLGSYSVLIVDEAHERKLSTDNHIDLFGLLKEIAQLRPDLKLLFISNSAAYVTKLSAYFDNAIVIPIPFMPQPPIPDPLEILLLEINT